MNKQQDRPLSHRLVLCGCAVHQEKFATASKSLDKLPSVSNSDKLTLYALFKQATEGDNTNGTGAACCLFAPC